jgi:hypothetical protein
VHDSGCAEPAIHDVHADQLPLLPFSAVGGLLETVSHLIIEILEHFGLVIQYFQIPIGCIQ